MKVLCVAEKNSIAKEVSRVLSNGHSRVANSPDKYVKNYCFKYNFSWSNMECDVTMTAVRGHLTELTVPHTHGWGKVDPETLFDCPLDFSVGNGMDSVALNIAELSQGADVIMIWTDCDREGEYIGGEIIGVANSANPQLTVDTALRAKFSHLERSHVIKAANQPGNLDKEAIQAVKTRIELDLRTGFAFTRLLTGGLQRELPLISDGKKPMVSFGNCQFPTLGFVVDRFNRLKEFKKENYWVLSFSMKKGGNKKYKMQWNRGRLFDRLNVICLYQSCIILANDQAQVVELNEFPTSNWAPLPLTTVEMQKDCSKIFKFSAKDTLGAAEALYQKGLVSYPRTETDKFPSKMDLGQFVAMQTDNPVWGSYAQNLIQSGIRSPRAGKHDDEAHPPIHPVNGTEGHNLNAKEAKVYEYIVRRFLACCSKDAKGQKRTLTVQWGHERFSMTGLTVTERNYLEIYPYTKWESNKVEVPDVRLGETVQVAECKIQMGQTSPPAGITETELIALMDLNGIGTDATIADHIERILQRGYIVKVKRKQMPWGPDATLHTVSETGRGVKEFLTPTALGYGLAMGFSSIGLDNISLTKPFLRKDMETQLTMIANGQLESNKVVRDTLATYREAFEVTRRQMNILKNWIRETSRTDNLITIA